MNSNFCKKAGEWYSPYLDGELEPENCSKLEEHFRVCSSCEKSYKAFTALFEGVRALPEVPASDAFETRLWARIRAEEKSPRRSWWADFSRIPVPIPLGAAALLLVAVFAFHRSSGDRVPVATTPDSAALRAELTDSIRTRSNTIPSFLHGVEGAGGLGRVASVGAPTPHMGHPVRMLVDMNGVPLEGPYEPEFGPPRPYPATRSPRAGGAVDTSSGR